MKLPNKLLAHLIIWEGFQLKLGLVSYLTEVEKQHTITGRGSTIRRLFSYFNAIV
jgi:hypothetical protein